ncbi:MAG: amidase [Tetrasphaera jenkinsii]|jgi:amidase|nr:amidase [Tetrasphaera jenkinsii]
MRELHDLTALELGAAVAEGEVTPYELVEHFGARQDRVGAFVTRTTDLALARANTLTRAGRPDDAGPLWGVPTAIKDLNATAGVRTTFGSARYAAYVPEHSDEVVRAIEDAGLISLGKTNAPEFGTPCYTESAIAPPAVTPYDTTRMAGGSSGGAAAAVAAGLVPLAQGSDGGGSIRIPASCCGLVGFKPSRGRISAGPMYGDPTGLATNGPIARTVRDAAAYLDVMAGRALGDPAWAPPLPPGAFLAACDTPPTRLRIARFATPAIVDAPVHPEVMSAYENATRLLTDLGHEVVNIPNPLPPNAVETFEKCWSVLTALSVPEGTEDDVQPLTRWLAHRGHAVSGPGFGLAIGELRRVGAAMIRALAAYDAVLTPTLAQPPLPVGALRNDADPAADFAAQKAFTPWTSLWNVTGMPAASLPLHRTPAGLPIGVMLAGRPARDDLLLALCAQVEDAAGGFVPSPQS